MVHSIFTWISKNREREFWTPQNNPEKLFLQALVIIFLFKFFVISCAFFNLFPNGYVWGENFIKYTNGIIRRGLIGSFLYSLSDIIDIQIFWTLFMTAVYAIFFIYVWNLLKKTVNIFFTIVLFFSPGLFSFFISHTDVYGRKDFFIFIFLGLIMVITVKMIVEQKVSWQKYLLIFTCYCLSFVIHELTIFFSLLPALLIIRTSKNKIVCILVIVIIFIVSVTFAVLFQGTEAMRDAMFHDWQNKIPSLTEPGGMYYIGKTLKTHDIPLPYLKIYTLRLSYAWAWALTLAPIALFFYIYRCHAICVTIMGHFWAWCSYACALFPCITLTFLISDFGRTVSYSSIMFLLFILMILTIHNFYEKKILPRPVNMYLSITRLPILAIAIMYITLWRLIPWVPLGNKASIISSTIWIYTRF